MHTRPDLAFQSLSQQDAFQSAALVSLLQYLSSHSPFYRRWFQQHGADIAAVRGLNDLHLLPATTKSDMQEQNMDFLCVPRSGVKEYTATSGTMGRPVTIALTENDLRRLAYNEHQSFLCADGTPGDTYQLMLTLDRQFMAGMAYYMGIRDLGAALIRTGPGLPAMQWDTIQRLSPTALVSVPSFIVRLIDWAHANRIDLAGAPVLKAICIGESVRGADFELNSLGLKIASQWPVKLYSTYASTEMQTAFTECGAGQGGHHQPDLLIMEVLDEQGRPLPAGEYGELTITTLGIEGMPLLRYRTGDICAYYDEPCSCGRFSRRLSPIMGRKQQMIKYKGTTLYPPALFDLLNNIPYIIEYVVEVFSSELHLDELRIHIHSQLPAGETEQQLDSVLRAKLRVIPHLRFHDARAMEAMQFPATSRKQVKFIDNRVQ